MNRLFECKEALSSEQITIMRIIGEASDRVNEKCYLVGGLVRDCLLGKKGEDLNFVCSNPKKVIHSIHDLDPSMKEDVKKEATRFQSHIIRLRNEKVDIVLPRKESYTRESIKPVVSLGDFKDDVERRDFTINTLYLGVGKDDWLQVKDLTGKGLSDLKKSMLNTPMHPDITFQDDPTRMLRAVRFSACKNMNIDPNVIASIQDHVNDLDRVPKELIHNELIKGAKCDFYFSIMDQLNILQHLFPEVTDLKGVPQNPQFHKLDAFNHTLATVEELPNNSLLRLAGLFHDLGKAEKTTYTEKNRIQSIGHAEVSADKTLDILSRLKFSHAETDHVTKLVKEHHMIHNFANFHVDTSDKAIKRALLKNGDIYDDLKALTIADVKSDHPDADQVVLKEQHIILRMDRLWNELQATPFKLAINGNDIMKFNYTGKDVGIVKKRLEDYVLEHPSANNQQDLLSLLANNFITAK